MREPRTTGEFSVVLPAWQSPWAPNWHRNLQKACSQEISLLSMSCSASGRIGHRSAQPAVKGKSRDRPVNFYACETSTDCPGNFPGILTQVAPGGG